jgi:hypothetical protein
MKHVENHAHAELTDEKIKLAEAFIGKLYNQVTDTSDEARDLMFGKSKSLESLPSTSDALKLQVCGNSECCQASFAFSYNYGLELGW